MLHSLVTQLDLPDIEGVDPLFLHLPTPDEVPSATDWARETVELLAGHGLVGSSHADAMIPLLLPLVQTPISDGCVARLLFVTGPAVSWLPFELGLWPASGDIADLLPAAIGVPVDEHLGLETEVIEAEGRTVYERFHLVATEPSPEAPGERPVRLVGGVATRLTDPRLPAEFDVALVTSTTDLSTLLASMPTLVSFLVSDQVIDLITA